MKFLCETEHLVSKYAWHSNENILGNKINEITFEIKADG